MQKGKIQDYESFKNEINILMGLVSLILHLLSSNQLATTDMLFEDQTPATLFARLMYNILQKRK